METSRWEAIIDKKEFESILTAGLTDEEICDFFMVGKDVLYKWVQFTYKTQHPFAYMKKLRARAKAGYLIEQRKIARGEVNGNATTSIWLGKNYFGQSDPDKAILRKDTEQNVDVEARPDIFDEIAKRLKGGN